MKKFLAIMAILLAVLFLILQFILPRVVENILKEQVINSTVAAEADVALSSNPNFRIALGEIDRVHATAAAGKIGEINFKNLTLDGEKIRLDVLELLFPSKDLTSQLRMQKILKHANKIELRGVVTDEELKNFIAAKDDNFQNTQVSIKPEGASASARAKFFGRTVDIEIAGNFIVSNGDVYFHMTNLSSNSIFKRVNPDFFYTDIKVLDSANLPLGLKFDSVELREGEAVVTAITAVQ